MSAPSKKNMHLQKYDPGEFNDSFEDEVNPMEDLPGESEIKDDLKPSMMRCRSFLLVLSSASTRSSDSWDSIKAQMSKK